MKNLLNNQKGYTLLELLAVMIVMAAVGLIVATILVSSLRGSNKTNVIDTVRENGNYTIQQMSKMIEFAQSFQGVSTTGTSYSSACTVPSTHYSYIKITSFDNGQTIFSCNMTSNPKTIASNSASFINTKDVSVVDCYLTCTRNNLSQSPTIGINFTLSQNSQSAFFEKKASIVFGTSVVIRNLNK
ncbi:MAG TPA: type II secretion system protein [Patescibacteria group bacterium]|nr:type II secretion system protein [Patescibacteria group bacterium]